MRAAAFVISILVVLGGFVPTWCPIDGPHWWVWVVLRVVLQLGGMAALGWVAANALFSPDPHMVRLRAQSIAWALAGGLLLCWAPVLDLIEGPVELEQATMAHYVERFTIRSRPHKRDELCFQDPDHRLACIRPVIPKLWWSAAAVDGCGDDATMDVAVLRHLEIVAGARCRPATWAPEIEPTDNAPRDTRAGHAWLEELKALPPAVAARRAAMVALTNPSTIYIVVYGSGPEDRYAVPLLEEALARRNDIASGYMRQRLREVYGVSD